MANALTETPPAPNPGSTNALSSGASPQPQGMTGPAPPGQPAAAPQQPAPPTHAQTMAALRHFDALKKEMRIILSDPALGKSSVKSKVIDGVTRLVAERFLKPSEAVSELAKVPTEPLLQMKWAKMQYQQAASAENAVLDHYGAGNPHFGTVAEHAAMPVGYNADDHSDHIGSLMDNYGKANG